MFALNMKSSQEQKPTSPLITVVINIKELGPRRLAFLKKIQCNMLQHFGKVLLCYQGFLCPGDCPIKLLFI